MVRIVVVTSIPNGGATAQALAKLGYKPYVMKDMLNISGGLHLTRWGGWITGKHMLDMRLFDKNDVVAGPPMSKYIMKELKRFPKFTKVILVEEPDKLRWQNEMGKKIMPSIDRLEALSQKSRNVATTKVILENSFVLPKDPAQLQRFRERMAEEMAEEEAEEAAAKENGEGQNAAGGDAFSQRSNLNLDITSSKEQAEAQEENLSWMDQGKVQIKKKALQMEKTHGIKAPVTDEERVAMGEEAYQAPQRRRYGRGQEYFEEQEALEASEAAQMKAMGEEEKPSFGGSTKKLMNVAKVSSSSEKSASEKESSTTDIATKTPPRPNVLGISEVENDVAAAESAEEGEDDIEGFELVSALETFEDQVKGFIPKDRLLVFREEQGYKPLINFVGMDMEDVPEGLNLDDFPEFENGTQTVDDLVTKIIDGYERQMKMAYVMLVIMAVCALPLFQWLPGLFSDVWADYKRINEQQLQKMLAKKDSAKKLFSEQLEDLSNMSDAELRAKQAEMTKDHMQALGKVAGAVKKIAE